MKRTYIEDTLKQFRERKHPVDAFIYDFEWYNHDNDYRIPEDGSASFFDFGWNKELFPEPAAQMALGHCRIAFLTGPHGNPSSDERLHGFKQAMAVAGVAVPKACIQHGNWLLDQTAEATRRLLSQTPRPTAIFCANDPMAAVVVQVATAMGYAVPQQLSVLGFSDHVIAQFVVPQLTTVAQPYREVGEQAIEMLADVAEGKCDPSDMRPALLPPRLVIRASTTAPAETSSV